MDCRRLFSGGQGGIAAAREASGGLQADLMGGEDQYGACVDSNNLYIIMYVYLPSKKRLVVVIDALFGRVWKSVGLWLFSNKSPSISAVRCGTSTHMGR